MPESETQVEKIPWENRKELGFFKALRLTRQEIIFHPVSFFSKMSSEERLVDSLVFALLMICLSTLIALTYSCFYLSWGIVSERMLPLVYVTLFFIIVLGRSAQIVFTAGIFHLGFLLAGARQGFKATFKVIAYTSAVEVFALLLCFLAFSFQFVIPLLPNLLFKKMMVITTSLLMAGGFLLLGLYPLILYFIGLKRVHNLGISRALCGFILPMAISIAAFMLLPKDSPRRVCPLQQPQASPQADNNVEDVMPITEKLPQTK